jgi:hypothetical protein
MYHFYTLEVPVGAEATGIISISQVAPLGFKINPGLIK